MKKYVFPTLDPLYPYSIQASIINKTSWCFIWLQHIKIKKSYRGRNFEFWFFPKILPIFHSKDVQIWKNKLFEIFNFQKWNKISKFWLLHDFRIIEVSRDKFSYLLFPSFLHMLYIYLSWFQKAHLSPNSHHYWFYEHLTVVHWSKKWPKDWSKSVLTRILKKVTF